MKLVIIPIYFNPDDEEINKLLGKESTLEDSPIKPISFAKVFDAICEDEDNGIPFTRLYYGDGTFATPWSLKKCVEEFDKLMP